jgi:hypothetical protein
VVRLVCIKGQDFVVAACESARQIAERAKRERRAQVNPFYRVRPLIARQGILHNMRAKAIAEPEPGQAAVVGMALLHDRRWLHRGYHIGKSVANPDFVERYYSADVVCKPCVEPERTKGAYILAFYNSIIPPGFRGARRGIHG